MKELSIEQKAQRFDEAIERAKSKIKNDKDHVLYENDIIDIFPELQESENVDEKVRKALIKLVTNHASMDLFIEYDIHLDEALSWLEKQGNINETINRDEFAQGVLRGAAINLITWIDYNAVKGTMCLSNMECKDIEDSLVNGNWDKIYTYIKKKLEKQSEQKPADKVESKFKVGDKIQYSKGCGTIMTIEKIENGEYIFGNNMGHTTIENGNKWYLVSHVEQNTAWSEEDEKMLDFAIRAVGLCKQYAINHQVNGYSNLPDVPKKYEELQDWLKSIKDWVNPKQGWSEEDAKCIDELIKFFDSMKDCLAVEERHQENRRWLKFLKSLKGTNIMKLLQEWSIEDNIRLQEAIRIVQNYHNNIKDEHLFATSGWCLGWLKSLRPQNTITDEELAQAKKDAYNDALDKIEYTSEEPTFDDGWSAAIDYIRKKYLRPQNKWKPSDEQITWLYRAADDASKDSRMKQILNELLSDLKKLREG